MIGSHPTHRGPHTGPTLPPPIQALVDRGDWAAVADALRVVLAVNPSLDAARIVYVRALLMLGRPLPAWFAFKPLRDRSTDRPLIDALATWIDAAIETEGFGEADIAQAVERAPGDADALHRLAQWRIANRRWEDALGTLLELVARDRDFGDDAGRRGMLAVFELCDDPALVRTWRRRLAAGLH